MEYRQTLGVGVESGSWIKTPWVDPACADCPGFWSWVLLMPRPPPSSRSLILCPWASILLHGPLDTCSDLLPASPPPPVQKRDAQHMFLQHRGARGENCYPINSKTILWAISNRAALEGTNLRGQTPICGFLRFPAKISGFLRKSAFPKCFFFQEKVRICNCREVVHL